MKDSDTLEETIQRLMKGEKKESLLSLVAQLDEDQLREVMAIAAMHPDALLRLGLVHALLGIDLGSDLWQLLLWDTEDDDEVVAARAVVGLLDSLPSEEPTPPELWNLARRAPTLLSEGVAAPNTLRLIALSALVSKRSGAPDSSVDLALASPTTVPPSLTSRDEMVLIQKGPFEYGGSPDLEEPWFPLVTYASPQTIDLPAYYIDRFPVTIAEYAEFVDFAGTEGHVFCHHDEPPNWDHAPTPYPGIDYLPEMPVTGINWYDAWAYAHWRGKTLPSDFEWEKATATTSAHVYPWGHTFTGDECNWLGMALDTRLSSRAEWERWIVEMARRNIFPPKAIRPSNEFPLNVSGYGVYDMVGNVWEWTRTRLLDQEDLDPIYRGLNLRSVGRDWRAEASIRGGSWTSAGEMLLPTFRGGHPLFCRGPEVGFRCVAYEDGSTEQQHVTGARVFSPS